MPRRRPPLEEERADYDPLATARCATHYVLAPNEDAYSTWLHAELQRRADDDERFRPIIATRPVVLNRRTMHPEAVVVYLDGWQTNFPSTGSQSALVLIAKARERGIRRYGQPPVDVMRRIINEQLPAELALSRTRQFVAARDGVVQLPDGAMRRVSANEIISYEMVDGSSTVTYIDPIVGTGSVELNSPNRSGVTHYVVSPSLVDYRRHCGGQVNEYASQDLQSPFQPRRISSAADMRGLTLQSHQRIQFTGQWRSMVDLPEIVDRFMMQRQLRPAEHEDSELDRARRHLRRIAGEDSPTVSGASVVTRLQRQLAQKTSECNSLRRVLNRISNNAENYTLQERTQAEHAMAVADGLTVMWRTTRNPDRWLLVSAVPGVPTRNAVYKWNRDRRQFVSATDITVAVTARDQTADDDLVFDDEDEDA